MTGTGEKTFSPHLPLTRGQFVTVLCNMEGKPKVSYSGKFTDVKATDYYAAAVEWAAAQGITRGVGENRFAPGQKITREQLATMLYGYAKVKNLKTAFDKSALNAFPDKGGVSEWAAEGMQWAVSRKVIGGKAANGATALDPSGFATRAECAQMIKNFWENVQPSP